MGSYLMLFFGMGGVALVAAVIGLLVYLAVNCGRLGGSGVCWVMGGFPVGYCQALVLLLGALLLMALLAIRQRRDRKNGT